MYPTKEQENFVLTQNFNRYFVVCFSEGQKFKRLLKFCSCFIFYGSEQMIRLFVVKSGVTRCVRCFSSIHNKADLRNPKLVGYSAVDVGYSTV